MSSKKNASDWRQGSKRRMIAELADSGKTKRETFAQLKPLVTDQIKPMVFAANVSGSRIPKPINEQYLELRNDIGRVYAELGRATSSDFDSEETEVEVPDVEIPADACDNCGKVRELHYDTVTGKSLCDDCLNPEPVKPEAAGKKRIREQLARFLVEVRRIRKLCDDRARTGARLDSISMRPAQAAAKLIPAGIPPEALLHAMLMHWKPEIRREAGIPDFDFVRLSKEIMRNRGIDPTGKHELFGYALVLAENRQPVMLVGPAGTGKSRLALQISEFLGFNYGETPMTAGATRGDLLGRMTASPERSFIISKFAEIYTAGGVFNFEEIDAADPGMLIVLNNAMSGDYLFNSSNGETYKKSPDCCPFATANTFGIGATSEYTGREKLDAATIDRWRMGRIFVELDENVEEGILYGNL